MFLSLIKNNYFLKSKTILLINILKYIRFFKKHQSGYCSACGKKSLFLYEKNNLKESLHCIYCNAWLRLRFLSDQIIGEFSMNSAKSLSDLIKEQSFKSLKIYEAQAEGPIHNQLKNCNNYICSEYLDNIKSGDYFNGIRCEDIQNLSFSNNKFDLIIHTSVMEHVRDPELSFKEQYRVLKPGGMLIFEIPMTDIGKNDIRKKSMQRIKIIDNEDIYVLDPVYHGDPIRKKGAVVYTDWGMDIINLIKKIGFNVSMNQTFIENSSMSHIVVLNCQK